MEEEIVIEFPPMVSQQPTDNLPDLTRSCSPCNKKIESKEVCKSSTPLPSRFNTPYFSPELSPKSILRNKNTTPLTGNEPSFPTRPPPLVFTSQSSPKQTYSPPYSPKTMHVSQETMTTQSHHTPSSVPLFFTKPPFPPRTFPGIRRFRPVMMTNGSLLLHSSRPVSPFEISV